MPSSCSVLTSDFRSFLCSAAAETEAQGALRQARLLYDNGRVEKAQRLFQRALQFSPRSPDVLTAYGEFLHREKDPLEAEKMLAKALLVQTPALMTSNS